MRYTAKGEFVYAIVGDCAGRAGPVTLADVQATPTTSVESTDGTPLAWRQTPSGLEANLPAGGRDGPAVMVLHRVEARSAPD